MNDLDYWYPVFKQAMVKHGKSSSDLVLKINKHEHYCQAALFISSTEIHGEPATDITSAMQFLLKEIQGRKLD